MFWGGVTYAQHEQQYQAKSTSPDWVKMMYSENADPGEVVEAYKEYYRTHELVKNQHTQYYKRWIRSFSRPTGYASSAKNRNYIEKSLELRQTKAPNSQWNCIGPFDFDIDAASRSYAPGSAHVYTVERSESNTQIMYAGTATAGLWKSTDGGQNWDLVTQDYLVNGIFAIEIDHSTPDVVYFESGGELYKTTDGGVNWNTIGDASFNSVSHSAKDIVMSPSNTNEIYFTSNHGFYRTTDGGANWTQIMSGEFQEIEINPSDPTMIYTIKVVGDKTEFYKSTDSGQTFTIKPNGWPNPGPGDEQKRVEIAVTPANSNYIYANATGAANGGSGTYGIYFSSDMGENWTFQCCGTQPSGPASLSNPNLMAWSKDGTEDGGQFYYDVALAVDPVDPLKLHLGGVNHWISTDGGQNWTCPAKWSEPDLPQYVHADIHDIRFFGTELWIACDGGIFMSTDGGANINKSQFGIAGTDFWGFGASPQSDVMLGGAYHNGTLLMDNNTYLNDWICTGGGDGVRGFVNFGDDRIAYDDWEGRILSGDRTQPIQGFQFDSLPNASYIIGASSRLTFDPRNYNHIYLGRGNRLIKTEDNGQTYTNIYDFGKEVKGVEVAWTNVDVMYVATYEDWWGAKQIWKTTDGGNTWTDITPPSSMLGGNTWVPWDITVSSNDENILWAARTSQYSDSPNLNGNQVYKTTDGGQNWTNITTSTIDDEWITNIVHQRGTDGGVYIGTRRAVYYRNATMSDWALFNNNLPLSTPSTKLTIKYKDKLLRNATSRSVYEVETYDISTPQAQIAADKFEVSCLDEVVQFVDHSVLSNDNPTWSWSFPGGTPASSTQQNPTVTYTSPGTYDVTLTVTDDYGTSTQSYTAFIEYTQNVIPANLQEDFETGFDPDWKLYNANGTYSWSTVSITNGPDCIPTNCARINHYDIDAVGDEAELITPFIDLTSVTTASLVYDYAYAKYGGSYEDGFRIDISTDCGATWDTLFYAFGDSLETVDDVGNWWEPADCADWSLDNTIDLQSYIGTEAMIRFVGINGYGNNFYLDNVNIETNSNGVDEQGEYVLEVFPNPSKGQFVVEHNFTDAELKIFSMEGKLVYSQQLRSGKELIQSNLSTGIYEVQLSSNDYTGNIKIVVE